MATDMAAAPVLSTPDTHILEAGPPLSSIPSRRALSDEELHINYDIERTLREIRQGRWKRIALQFPDEMLSDSPRVFQLLARGLESNDPPQGGANDGSTRIPEPEGVVELLNGLNTDDSFNETPRLYILADTSYGTCCVDEVAAEHVNADVVVHYGRACLSPTARLPVIHVFTHQQLSPEPLIQAFMKTYPDTTSKILIAASVTYSDHVPSIHARLVQEGYTNLFATSVLHDPSSPIPNRTIPEAVKEDPESLKDWQLFHISDPPTALLLTLSFRVSTIHIYPTEGSTPDCEAKPLLASTASTLRRRYATLTSLSTVPIFGILINTLSVKNYLHIVDHVKEQIAAAGKKSYMFVVGKLNAAKVANFSEIGGWVVIGCWESSLIDSADFWKPVITPYELELALRGDEDRVWTGEWRSDYQNLLDAGPPSVSARQTEEKVGSRAGRAESDENNTEEDETSEPESAPPEFDLRTGRYISVSSTRPMQSAMSNAPSGSPSHNPTSSNALAKRANGDLATIGNTVSPGAEFLRSQRTWKGLGSDFNIGYDEDEADSTTVVEGRSGIARGYTVGDTVDRS